MNSNQRADAHDTVDMSVRIGEIGLKNPLLTASGTCGYASEYYDFADLGDLGGFVTKSISLDPLKGNNYPRTVETRAGMLNAIGLANVGLEAFIRDKVPDIETLGLPTIVNIAGKTPEEYIAVAEALEDIESIAGCELNISCPNVKSGGIQFGTDPDAVRAVTAAVKSACRKNTLIVKLSPNVKDIAEIAAAAVEGGAEALSLINTLTGMAVDIETRTPVLDNGTGGLSGPAIRPVAVAMVHKVYREVAGPADIPLIGMGGIQRARDALEFFIAGATAVAVGTALFIDPNCISHIRRGIKDYLVRHGFDSVRQLTGTLETR